MSFLFTTEKSQSIVLVRHKLTGTEKISSSENPEGKMYD